MWRGRGCRVGRMLAGIGGERGLGWKGPGWGDGRKVEMARERSSAGGRGMRCSILRGAPTYREPWIQLATYSRQDGSTWEKYHSRLPKLVLDPPSCQQLNSDFQIQQLDAPPPSLSLSCRPTSLRLLQHSFSFTPTRASPRQTPPSPDTPARSQRSTPTYVYFPYTIRTSSDPLSPPASETSFASPGNGTTSHHVLLTPDALAVPQLFRISSFSLDIAGRGAAYRAPSPS